MVHTQLDLFINQFFESTLIDSINYKMAQRHEHINYDTTNSATGSAKDATKHPVSGISKAVGDTLGAAVGAGMLSRFV